MYPATPDPYNTVRTPFVVYASICPPIHTTDFRDDLGTPHEARMSMVGTGESRGYVIELDGGSNLNDAR
jgi:hypothetical protein